MAQKKLTPQEIKDKLRKLPEDLKGAFYSEEIAEAMQGLGKKHKLTVDKVGDMYTEVIDVILGITHPKDFIKNLTDNLQIDPQKAKDIAQDVNVAIFKPIRESLKKIHGISDSEMPKDEPKAPPAMKMPPKPMAEPSKMGKASFPTFGSSNISKPAVPLSTKPHPDLTKPLVGHEMKLPAEKPMNHPAPTGSFKAGNYEKVNDMKINASPQISPDMPSQTPPKQPFWKKPLLGVKQEEAKIKPESIPTKKLPDIIKPEPNKESVSDIFTKKIQDSIDLSPEPVKPAVPIAPTQTPAATDIDKEALKGELEKELNTKRNSDPYREPVE